MMPPDDTRLSDATGPSREEIKPAAVGRLFATQPMPAAENQDAFTEVGPMLTSATSRRRFRARSQSGLEAGPATSTGIRVDEITGPKTTFEAAA